MFQETVSSRVRGAKFWSISPPPRMRTFSKRDNGSRGRSLQARVPHLPLQAHYRLKLCTSLADVGAFDSVTQFPLRTVWWRPSMESSTRHKNPLVDPRLGLDPAQCLTADMLHATFVGVMRRFCRRSLWFLLLGGAWCLMSTQEETIEVGTQSSNLPTDMRAWRAKIPPFPRTQRSERSVPAEQLNKRSWKYPLQRPSRVHDPELYHQRPREQLGQTHQRQQRQREHHGPHLQLPYVQILGCPRTCPNVSRISSLSQPGSQSLPGSTR